MVTIQAHFDGKVIVPDEPIELPPNQPLVVRIEAVTGSEVGSGSSVLTWLVANAPENDSLPEDLADRHDHYLYHCSPKDSQQ